MPISNFKTSQLPNKFLEYYRLYCLKWTNLITAFKETAESDSAEELNADMSFSFRRNPAKGGENVIVVLELSMISFLGKKTEYSFKISKKQNFLSL